MHQQKEDSFVISEIDSRFSSVHVNEGTLKFGKLVNNVTEGKEFVSSLDIHLNEVPEKTLCISSYRTT